MVSTVTCITTVYGLNVFVHALPPNSNVELSTLDMMIFRDRVFERRGLTDGISTSYEQTEFLQNFFLLSTS